MAIQAKRIIEDAVIRTDAKVSDKLLDKAFALAFKGLVYAQIWEDPVVDMEGLAIHPEARVMCIASGSCNALSYLTANPESVTAVDLNHAHVALGRLKIAAIRHLPNYERFHRFFAHADHKENAEVYRTMIARIWMRKAAPIGKSAIFAGGGGFLISPAGFTARDCWAISLAWPTSLPNFTRSIWASCWPLKRWRNSAPCSSGSWPRCSKSASSAG